MIADDKIREFRKMIRSGVPPGEVEEELRKQGYSQEDIQKVFYCLPFFFFNITVKMNA